MKTKTFYISLFLGAYFLVGWVGGYAQSIADVKEQSIKAEVHFEQGEFLKSKETTVIGIQSFEKLSESIQNENSILKAKLYQTLALAEDSLARRLQIEQNMAFNIDSLNLKSIIEHYILGIRQTDNSATRPLTKEEKDLLFDIYSEMGEFYSYWQAYNIANEYFDEAQDFSGDVKEKKEKNLKDLAGSHNKIAQIEALDPQKSQQNIRQAIQYYQDLESLLLLDSGTNEVDLKETRLSIADLYLDLNDYPNSENYYTTVNQEHTLTDLERATVLNNLGYLALAQGKQAIAETHFEKAQLAVGGIENNPNFSNFYVTGMINQAENLRREGRFDEGLKKLDTLLNTPTLSLKKPQTQEDSILKAAILNYKGANYYTSQNYSEAKNQSEKAIKLLNPDANDPASWEALAISYARLREVNKKWQKRAKEIEYDKKAREIEGQLEAIRENQIRSQQNETEEREEDFREIEDNVDELVRRSQRIRELEKDSANRAVQANLERERAEAEKKALEEEQNALRAQAAQREQEARNAALELEAQKAKAEQEKAEREIADKEREAREKAREDSLKTLEQERKRKEEDAKKAAEQERKERERQFTLTIIFTVIGFLVLIVLGVLYGLYRSRKTNKMLAKQQEIILQNNQELTEQKAEIQEKNEELNQIQEEITAQNELLILRSKELKEKSDHITESIQYAQRIQEAMLPHLDAIRESLPESFVLFRPRDIVSGDFYWFLETLPEPIFGLMDTPEGRTSVFKGITGAKKIITAVDCTGHGVPGAFMSMIGHELLNNIVEARGIKEADKILNELHLGVAKALRQRETENRDGMDMALCVIDEEAKTLIFAGAKNPLVYIEKGELVEIKADKVPIGGEQLEDKRLFTPIPVDISEPKTFYVFSDGFQDQFGGPKGKKFMKGKFKKLLLEIHQKPFDEQRQILDDAIEDWIQNSVNSKEEQVDDVLVIGFRVGGEVKI